MDDATMAAYAAEFMKRVQLQGAEVPAFNAVMGWLDNIGDPGDIPAEDSETP